MWIQTNKSSSKANKINEKEKFVPHLVTWDNCDSVQVKTTANTI